jgi:hypothetical protein
VRSRLAVNVTATNADGTPNAGAVLTLVGFGQLGPALPAAPGVPAPPGTFAIRMVGVNPIPSTVTITSSSGGTVTAPVTIR